MEDIMTFSAACEFLGITARQMYGYTGRKLIPYYKPTGRHIYFRRSELVEFVTANRIATAAEVEAQAQQLARKPAAV